MMNVLQFCSNFSEINSRRKSFNLEKSGSLVTPETSSIYAAQFGIISGVSLILVLNAKFAFKCGEEAKNVFMVHRPHIHITTAYVLQRSSTSIFILLLPIILLILMFGAIHKLASWVIIISIKSKFVSMMGSFDRIWAIEDEETKSIINAVGLVGAQSCKELLSDIKECIQKIFDRNEKSTMKMFLRRGYSYGYHYWQGTDNLNLDRYIQTFQCLDSTEVIKDIANLEKTVSTHCNDNMPYENTALWQILICEQFVSDGLSNENSGKKYFPLMFRIHHSLGDGVALVKLLRKMLDDTSFKYKNSAKSTSKKITKNGTENPHLKNVLCSIFQYTMLCLKIIVEVPACLVAQSLRPVDDNMFHGPMLTGDRVAVWMRDENDGEDILKAMKRIKSKIPGLKFSDLLIMALSAGFKEMFEVTSPNSEPTSITSVVPGRICHDADVDPQEIRLENRFSVALLEVPVAGDTDARTRLMRVKSSNQVLRTNSAFVANYIFLLLASCVLPERILRPLLYSRHATTVFSNMPGPPAMSICGGHSLEQLIFLLPNKGTTGIGISAFSYGGRLRLGLLADAGVAGRDQLQVLLRGMLREIARLDAIFSGRTASQMYV